MLVDDAIVDGAKARILATGIAAGNVHADMGEPTQDTKLPVVNLFVALDEATAEGGPRTGIARFEHVITLVVEVLMRGNSARAVKSALGTAGEGLLTALLSDRDWAALNGDPVIEGFGKVKRVYDLPPDGNHYLGRLQLQIDILHRTAWPPSTTGLPDLSAIALNFALDSGDVDPVIGADVTVPTD